MKAYVAALAATHAIACTSKATPSSEQGAARSPAVRPVFLIVMENQDWSAIRSSQSAPYINGTMLEKGAHAELYLNPKKLHPSEPNYIWLEAGDNLGITNDEGISKNHLATTDHLVTLIEKAGKSWLSYQEDISGTKCPLHAENRYVPRHNPMLFFDDVTSGGDSDSKHCIEHVRPYGELAADLEKDRVADYNLITPNSATTAMTRVHPRTTPSLRSITSSRPRSRPSSRHPPMREAPSSSSPGTRVHGTSRTAPSA